MAGKEIHFKATRWTTICIVDGDLCIRQSGHDEADHIYLSLKQAKVLRENLDAFILETEGVCSHG